jgi:alkylhydroperoxidase family enzyme
MAWIETVPDNDAQGVLATLYDASRQRAGRVFNIVRAQSLNPPVLKAGVGLYQAAMFGPSELSRGLRELLGVVVSRTNGCHY